MDGCGKDFTKRTRCVPSLPKHLMRQLKWRMMELGLHADHHLHMGELTNLFTNSGFVMVAKQDCSRTCLYPPDKELAHVISELGDW